MGKNGMELHVTVSDMEQFDTVKELVLTDRIRCLSRLFVEMGVMCRLTGPELSGLKQDSRFPEVYPALPRILREDENGTGYGYEDLCRRMEEWRDHINGILIRTPGEIALVCDMAGKGLHACKRVVLDHSLYVWNRYAMLEYREMLPGDAIVEYTLPLELTGRELEELVRGAESLWTDGPGYQMVVYGRVPMMLTANCIRKTEGICRKDSSKVNLQGEDTPEYLTDRKNRKLPVSVMCDNCMNIIWNSVPLSLHKQYGDITDRLRPSAVRIGLSVENAAKTREIIMYWDRKVMGTDAGEAPYGEYTTGHYRQGVL